MDDNVESALAEARALGFLGPGPIEQHETSAAAFIETLGAVRGRALDLGSGGGVPGLLLAAHYDDVEWLLLDIHRRRTSFLGRTVAVLGWADRVTVLRESADIAAHSPALRGKFDLVVARSFGPPAVAAECAAGFLRVGGRLAVAEPPTRDQGRWDEPQLLGLGLAGVGQGAVAVFRQVSPAPTHVPRPWKTIDRRPLW